MERKWWTLIAVSVAIFMLLLDITVVNVALPDIQRSLHSSLLRPAVGRQRLLADARRLPADGRRGRRSGRRRRVFVAGLVVFTFSSAVCGLSTTPLMLNLARAVQGAGGAMMFATSLALIAQAFHGKERGTAFGVYGAVTGAAVAVGPVIGGIITSGIGWEWIFFVNVPIGIVARAHRLTQVAESRDPDATGVDWPGLVTFSGALFLLVFALVQGNEKGWGSTEIVACLAGRSSCSWRSCSPSSCRAARCSTSRLFRRPAFTGASIVAFTVSASIFSMFLYLTLYIQDVLGYRPCRRAFASCRSRCCRSSSPRSPAASACACRCASCWARASCSSGRPARDDRVDATSTWTTLIPGFVLAGAGIGLINPPLASTAVGVVHHSRSGMASGSTRPSARSGSQRASPGLARSSSTGHHNTTGALSASVQAHGVARGHPRASRRAARSGDVSQFAALAPRRRPRRSSTPTGSASPSASRRSR